MLVIAKMSFFQKSFNGSTDSAAALSDNDEESEEVATHPAGIKLRRAGYYTIPSMTELVLIITIHAYSLATFYDYIQFKLCRFLF
jgi:hypothetical protein